MNGSSKTDTSLTIVRTYNATPEELWELWTAPEKLSQWHHAPGGSAQAETDVRVGGAYKIAMTDQSRWLVFGEFTEVDKPNKLVYSWQWQGYPDEVSQVTVLLKPLDKGTELTLVHERLSGPDSVQAHSDGWLGVMENINQCLEGSK